MAAKEMRKSNRVRRAVNASSKEISSCLGEDVLIPSTRILLASELDDKEKAIIWNLFEENMHDLYSNSSFGWKPAERKEEIFHYLSRFIVVYDPEENDKISAFCMFRFENEEGENVVYCYDIQISSQHRRAGMGRKLIDVMCTIGRAFKMEKIVLTVLKENTQAMAFYRACGFLIDNNSPSVFLQGDQRKDDYDYEIMSRECES